MHYHEIVVALALPLFGSHSSGAAAGSVSGRIVSDGRAVPLASIELARLGPAAAADARRTQSDSLGRFSIDGVPGGPYRLSVRKIGYRVEAVAVVVEDGATVDQTINLERAAQTLDTVSVRDVAQKPERYAATSRLDEFYARRARGVGHFYTRDQLDSLGATSFAATLARAVGVRVAASPDGIHVHFARCQGALPIAAADGSGKSDADNLVALVIDGTRVPAIEVANTLDRFRLSDIEAIEVYGGPTELPLDAMGNACGAIYVWTRYTDSRTLKRPPCADPDAETAAADLDQRPHVWSLVPRCSMVDSSSASRCENRRTESIIVRIATSKASRDRASRLERSDVSEAVASSAPAHARHGGGGFRRASPRATAVRPGRPP